MPRSRAAATIAAASGCSLDLLERRGEPQRVRPRTCAPTVTTDDQLRLALGERAGLVDDERVDLSPAARAPRRSSPGRRCRAAPGADHDRHRRGQAQRARAGDDQHGYRVHQRVREPRLRAPRAPHDERRRSRPARPPARNTRTSGRPGAGSARGCAAPRRPCGRSARAACRCRPDRRESRATPVVLMVPPVTAIAGFLLRRDRFAGDHRFVDGAASVDHHAVDRDLLAGTHATEVADAHSSSGTSLLDAASDAHARSSARGPAAAGSPCRSGCRARSSSTWPSSTSAVITAAVSK